MRHNGFGQIRPFLVIAVNLLVLMKHQWEKDKNTPLDIFDLLSIKFPDHDFLILMDQSSGHGKSLENGLNADKMNVSHGGI